MCWTLCQTNEQTVKIPLPPLIPKTLCNSEYKTKTNADPTVLNAFAPAPLKNAVGPSLDNICAKQSDVPLYNHLSFGFSDCICNLLLTVSNGYDAYPAKIAVPWAIKNLDNALIYPLSLIYGLISFNESNTPNYTPLYGIIPITDTPNPFYNPKTPLSPDAVFFKQSNNPSNVLFPPPTSDANLVLA